MALFFYFQDYDYLNFFVRELEKIDLKNYQFGWTAWSHHPKGGNIDLIYEDIKFVYDDNTWLTKLHGNAKLATDGKVEFKIESSSDFHKFWKDGKIKIKLTRKDEEAINISMIGSFTVRNQRNQNKELYIHIDGSVTSKNDAAQIKIPRELILGDGKQIYMKTQDGRYDIFASYPQKSKAPLENIKKDENEEEQDHVDKFLGVTGFIIERTITEVSREYLLKKLDEMSYFVMFQYRLDWTNSRHQFGDETMNKLDDPTDKNHFDYFKFEYNSWPESPKVNSYFLLITVQATGQISSWNIGEPIWRNYAKDEKSHINQSLFYFDSSLTEATYPVLHKLLILK